MDWRDLFYFSCTERNGIMVLLVLILLVMLAPWIFGIIKPLQPADLSATEQQILRFQAQLAILQQQKDSLKTLRRQPSVFNPNELSAAEWQQMGVAAPIARSVEKYLQAGGSFRYREDLSRIYLIDDSLYAALEPFIDLPPRPGLRIPDRQPATKPVPEPLMLELNRADSLQLTQLRGIGPVFGSRIVRYREFLGGFHCIDQLLEVYGMDSLRLQGIRENLRVDTTLLRKISINSATVQQLSSHPYISFNTARSIVAIRNQHGQFETEQDILRSVLIDNQLLDKIRPYISISPENPAETKEISSR